MPSGFVALRDVDPTIVEEIRYAGPARFIGRPVRGYREPVCLLMRPAAQALRRVQRPQRAVDDFVAWVERAA